MKANHPLLWGKNPHDREIEKLVETAIEMAPKFIDGNPFTALMCLLGTIGEYGLRDDAFEALTQRLETSA